MAEYTRLATWDDVTQLKRIPPQTASFGSAMEQDRNEKKRDAKGEVWADNFRRRPTFDSTPEHQAE